MKNFFYLVYLVFIFSNSISAQNLSIYGTVKDTAGNNLAGANVVVANSNLGSATDLQGKYLISNLKPGKYSVEFSSIGYQKKIIPEIFLEDKPVELNVVLNETSVESRQVVVTASKYAQQISDLPVSVDVIHPEDFAKKNITDLNDAMRYAPGVNMIDDQVSIRGSSGYTRGAGSRVLLEIDGIPYYTGDTGDIIWEIIPVTDIRRVEIIKGAASSLYGSSAIGGVINVITNDVSKNPVTYFKMSLGAYDNPAYSIWEWTKKLRTFNDLTFSHSNKIGNFGYVFSLTRLEDLSYLQSGFYKRYIGYFKGSYDFSSSSSLNIFINGLDQNHGNFLYWKDSRHALQPADADQGQVVSANRYMFGVNYKNILNDKLFMIVRASYYRSNWNDNTQSNNSSLSNLYRIEVQANSSLSNELILVSGIESTYDNVNANIFGAHNSFGIGAYAQADYNFNFPLKTSIGFRYDYSRINSLEGFNSFSPKLGLNFKLNEKVSLRSSFGTGFRSPTLSEVYTTTSAGGLTIKPNPNLKPEKNWTLEFGANYQLNNFIDFDAAIFQNEFYDFIEPGVDPKDGLVFFNNITRARIQGAEVNSNYSLFDEKIKISFGYTYLWARDLQQNVALKYRPRHMATASLDYYLNNFNFGMDFRYSSKVEQMDYELVTLGLLKDGYKRVEIKVMDLRASYKLNSLGVPAKIYVNINNVFNYNYVELIGNIAPIRNYSLSLEFMFM